MQNPNNRGVLVHITYMMPDGHGNEEVRRDNSRGLRTFNMVDKGISGLAAISVYLASPYTARSAMTGLVLSTMVETLDESGTVSPTLNVMRDSAGTSTIGPSI